MVVATLTFTLLKLLSDWSALWLFSCSKELSRSALRSVMALLLSKQKHSLNLEMLTYCLPCIPVMLPEPLWYQKGTELGKDSLKKLMAFRNKSKSLGSAKSTRECVCGWMCDTGKTKDGFAVGRTGRYLEGASWPWYLIRALAAGPPAITWLLFLVNSMPGQGLIRWTLKKQRLFMLCQKKGVCAC